MVNSFFIIIIKVNSNVKKFQPVEPYSAPRSSCAAHRKPRLGIFRRPSSAFCCYSSWICCKWRRRFICVNHGERSPTTSNFKHVGSVEKYWSVVSVEKTGDTIDNIILLLTICPWKFWFMIFFHQTLTDTDDATSRCTTQHQWRSLWPRTAPLPECTLRQPGFHLQLLAPLAWYFIVVSFLFSILTCTYIN